MTVLGPHIEMLEQLEARRITGSVAAVRGLSVLVEDLPLPIGALVQLVGASRQPAPPARRGSR